MVTMVRRRQEDVGESVAEGCKADDQPEEQNIKGKVEGTGHVSQWLKQHQRSRILLNLRCVSTSSNKTTL